MEDPGGAEKFEHSGWTRAYLNDEIAKVKFDELFASDALLLRRVTHQGFAAVWTRMKNALADRMNGLAKYVVSATLKKDELSNSKIIRENLADEISKLKQRPGKDFSVSGSAMLVRAPMQNPLFDEFMLSVDPVVLSNGKRLFAGGDRMTLKLTESRGFASGVMLLRYQREQVG